MAVRGVQAQPNLYDATSSDPSEDGEGGQGSSQSSADEGDSLLPREERHKKAMAIRKLRHAVVVVATILVGMAWLMYFEGWDWCESLYVITQVITTIGYGDMPPHRDCSRMFLAFYALLILVLVAFFLNNFIQGLMDSHADAIRSRLRDMQKDAMTNFNPDIALDDSAVKSLFGRYNKLIVSTIFFAACIVFGTLYYPWEEGCTCSYGELLVENCTAETACEDGYTLNHAQAFYMSVITLTTVGFGDYSPKTFLGRMIGIVWMFIGVLAAAGWMEAIQEVFFKNAEERKFQEAEMMNQGVFDQIDSDGDGYLSKSEWIHYCVLKQRLVDNEVLEAIGQLYDRIDNDRSKSLTLAEISQYQSTHALDIRSKSQKRLEKAKKLCVVM